MNTEEPTSRGTPAQTERAAALEVLRAIEARGYAALIVGGAVRDHVLGRPMQDIDIATDMPMEEVRALFRAHDVGKSKDFGIFVVLHRGRSFEVAGFRGPTRFDSDRRPVATVPSATFTEDARRRDFTLNAMGMDARGNLHDPWDGIADIRDRLVRGVDDPGDRFEEDPVRLLRAVRFAARFGFDLEPATEGALMARVGDVRRAAPERIGAELAKMAAQSGACFAVAARWMARLGLLQHVLPEVEALRGMPHDACWHPEGDAFEHTLAACAASRVRDPLVHLAVLLHDVGKSVTYEYRRDRHTYLNHERVGSQLAEAVAKRLRYSAEWRRALGFAVHHHMKVHRIGRMRPAKVFRLVSDVHWALLKEVAYCDQAARGAEFDGEGFLRTVGHAEAAARRWQDMLTQPGRQKTVVDGRRVMALTGLPPGPEVGDLLRKITDWAIDNDVSDPASLDTQILKFAEELQRG